MIRINLISGPRNISTALMYAFAQRTDTTVLDEPFYACYLDHTGLDHPGKEEVVASQATDPKQVLDAIFEDSSRPILFIKNMAHHLPLVEKRFFEEVNNIFLIRNPAQILASYAKVIETPTLNDIGIEYQFLLFHRLRAQGQHPIILDARLLLENPESILSKVCLWVGIPFMKTMLHWTPGQKSYDGIWAKYWYSNVHTSSGFERQATSNRPLPAHLTKLNEQAQYYYKELLAFSVQP